jgi:predicted anti-sigma-YlaC factor YlaD
MISCEEVRELFLDGRLEESADASDALDEAALGEHLDTCDACAKMLACLEEGERVLSGLITRLAGTVAPNANPTEMRAGETLRVRRSRFRWRVVVPMAAALLAGVAFFGPRQRIGIRFTGGPDWALPVANLQSIQPIVGGSSSHSNVVVLPTENPNITVVWFME